MEFMDYSHLINFFIRFIGLAFAEIQFNDMWNKNKKEMVKGYRVAYLFYGVNPFNISLKNLMFTHKRFIILWDTRNIK